MAQLLAVKAKHPRQTVRGLRLWQAMNSSGKANGIAAFLACGKFAPAGGAQIDLAGGPALTLQTAACPFRANASTAA
ncbi:hypothetical protein [Lichenicoccus roseus]|uniref:hypothetical protein n=1 Tax=Lichenicoccus roseus TaxID=2683649 RepID=UPI0014874960|nr:hypothetical protein [Lichenicoccus roseus]